MNKKERVLNALQGKPVDRVPVTFYRHFFSQEDNTVSANVDWVKNTGMDMICVEPDGFYALHWDSALQTLDDWKKFRPHRKNEYFIAGQLDRARRIAEKLHDDAAVYYMLFTPFSFIKHTVGGGQKKVMNLWNEDKNVFMQVMDVIEEENCMLMDLMKETTGIDGFFISMQSAEKWRFTPEEYKKYLTPYDTRLIGYANSKYSNNIVHLCSWNNEPNNVEVWRDYDFKIVNWGVYQEENLSLRQGRDYFKPGTTLMGGFDRNPEGVLYRGSKYEIKSFTKDLIKQVGDAGLILSADCSIQEDTPDDHIRWVIEAAEEYAREK